MRDVLHSEHTDPWVAEGVAGVVASVLGLVVCVARVVGVIAQPHGGINA